MGSTLAVLAALAFATGTVLQQRGALRTEAPEGDPRFLAEIIRQPVWVAGGLCQALGWILQAVALRYQSLVVVQSLCALSLVFALPLGVRLTDQHVGRRAITGALLTLAGIVAFVAAGQPAGGVDQPDASAWWLSGITSVALMLLLANLARRRVGPLSAALFAGAAGIGFAYQAAVTKVFVTELGDGLAGVLTTWTTYALIVSALAGFALQQSALKTGHLAPAMATSNATTLVISVVLGVRIFGETLSGADGHPLAVVLGLGLAVAGIVLLAAPGQPEHPPQAPA